MKRQSENAKIFLHCQGFAMKREWNQNWENTYFFWLCRSFSNCHCFCIDITIMTLRSFLQCWNLWVTFENLKHLQHHQGIFGQGTFAVGNSLLKATSKAMAKVAFEMFGELGIVFKCDCIVKAKLDQQNKSQWKRHIQLQCQDCCFSMQSVLFQPSQPTK